MGDPSQLDRLEIMPVTAANEPQEPEEAAARRVQTLPFSVNLSNGLPEVTKAQGRPALNFQGSTPVLKSLAPVTTELTAGEVATAMKARCARCLHFRSEEWQQTKKVWEGAPDGSSRKIGLAKMVMQYARSCLDRPPDPVDLRKASYAMNLWGICSALSEERADLVIVHPEACCPEGVEYYQDRNLESRREGSSVYDRVLRAAQGKS